MVKTVDERAKLRESCEELWYKFVLGVLGGYPNTTKQTS